MRKVGLELKVGVFVMAALAILGVLVMKTGDFYLKPGYSVRFVFSFVSGVDTGSPVRLAGVNVGEVKQIHVVRDAEGQTQVEVIAWIAQGAYIEEDAEARINTLGLLGEKYIEVLPGTSGAKTLSDGGTLVGKTPIVMEKITESGNRLINKLETTVDHVKEMVSDPEFKSSVKNTFIDADKFTRNLMEASDDLKDAAKSARVILAKVKEGEGTMGRLFMDDTIAKDFEALVKDLKAHPWKLLKKG